MFQISLCLRTWILLTIKSYYIKIIDSKDEVEDEPTNARLCNTKC